MSLDEENTSKALRLRVRICRGERCELEIRLALASLHGAEVDQFVDLLLGVGAIPPDSAELPRGCVPYLPVGAAEIFAMIDEVPVRRGDIVVDVGSGLGRVLLLTHLMTGAAGVGVEVQAPLVRQASELVAAMSIHEIRFVHQDATQGLPVGDVYFLYAPFSGARMRAVMADLEVLALRQRVTICAAAFELRRETWLNARASSSPELLIYESDRV